MKTTFFGQVRIGSKFTDLRGVNFLRVPELCYFGAEKINAVNLDTGQPCHFSHADRVGFYCAPARPDLKDGQSVKFCELRAGQPFLYSVDRRRFVEHVKLDCCYERPNFDKQERCRYSNALRVAGNQSSFVHFEDDAWVLAWPAKAIAVFPPEFLPLATAEGVLGEFVPNAS